MSTPEDKKHKRGAIIHFEPQDITKINADPNITLDFEQVGRMRFCQKIQGYHLQLTKEFGRYFYGVQAKVGSLDFPVSSQSIAEDTETSLIGEEWFKGMQFDLIYFKDSLKPKHWREYGSDVLRSYLQDHHRKMLEVIQRYFTCEGSFSKVYNYQIRLLMYFMGNKSLNILYYLFRSLCNMVDRVQTKGSQVEASLFHFSLSNFW